MPAACIRSTEIAAHQKANNDMAVIQDDKRLTNDPGNLALQGQLERDQATGNSLGLRLNALNQAYVAAEGSQASTAVISPLSTASVATSDRSSRVQTLAGVGLLAGLVIGVGLAMWRASRVTRRRFLG